MECIRIDINEIETAISALQARSRQLEESDLALRHTRRLLDNSEGKHIDGIERRYSGVMRDLYKVKKQLDEKIFQLKEIKEIYLKTELTCQQLVDTLPDYRKSATVNQAPVERFILRTKNGNETIIRMPVLEHKDGCLTVNAKAWKAYITPGPVVGNRLQHEGWLRQLLAV